MGAFALLQNVVNGEDSVQVVEDLLVLADNVKATRLMTVNYNATMLATDVQNEELIAFLGTNGPRMNKVRVFTSNDSSGRRRCTIGAVTSSVTASISISARRLISGQRQSALYRAATRLPR